jgi:toxin secretion/phage lysis holin
MKLERPKTMEDKLKLVVQAGISWVAAQFLGISMAMWALVIALGVDVATGLIAAWYQGTPIKSRDFHRGLVTKALILFLCMLGHPLETFLSAGVGVSVEMHMERWLPLFFVFGEVVSILENFHRCNVPLPAFLIDAIVKGRSLMPKPATDDQIKALSEDNGGA